jgi:PAS domain S-box-containing protein
LHGKHSATLAELERYKVLVDNVQDYAIFLMDPHGHILTWNKGAQKNKGYKAHEIIGKHFSTFYLEKDKKVDKPGRELVLAKKHGRVEDEDWRVRKDGSKFWANVVITTLYDDDGQHIGFAKVTRDLTERKHQEDALRQANMVLRQQQAELRKLNDSKDEFISLASHQLRTPATAVKQLLGILLEGMVGEISDETRQFIDRAYESNERQINIVNNLLKVAQLDAGKVTLHKQPVDIQAMLHSIVKEQEETFSKRDQQVRVDVPAPVDMVQLDPEQFRMAFANLIDNASKYTHEGGTIKIGASQHGKKLKLTVQDNGIGIPAADLKELFGKFKRIPNELSDKVGGSGLGLYYAQRIIDLHGAELAVSSQPDKGTTFTITLPTGD